MKGRFRVVVLAACVTGHFLLAVVAEASRLEMPRGVFYYQPAASVFGAEAAWVNPAALARYTAASVQLLADYADDDFAKSWGVVSNRDRIALGYRTLDNPAGTDYKEYVFATGMSLGRDLQFGGSYRYYKDAPDDFRKRHLWNIGLSGGQGHVRWAATFENLNHARDSLGRRTETEQRYSLSLRPLGRSLTVSVDMFLSTGTRLSHADFVYHAELASTRGLYLCGQIDSDRNFQIGVRANLVQYIVGAKSGFNRHGDHTRTTVFVGGTSMRQPSLISPGSRRLSLGMGGRMSENPPRPVFGPRQTAFATLILNLYRAADDPSIGELVVAMTGPTMGFGQAQELREALENAKRHGKKVTCHLSSPNNIGYYIASAADRILIPPVCQLNLVGLRAELTFYAGTLDKLGVKADIIRIGEHKTAPEKYTSDAASPAHREQINYLLDDLYDQFVTALAEGRHITRDSVRILIDRGPFTSIEALEFGLVDGLSYRDQMSKDVLSPMAEISFRKYIADTLTNDGWPQRPELALVVAEGEMGTTPGGLLPIGGARDLTSRDITGAFGSATSNPRVRGVVFRINSPGGLALVGEEIHRAAQTAGQDKPVVASMANVAASGGYYIAMPCRHLVANAACITGSIGIYGGKPDLSGLYDKVDLGKELYVRGKYAGMLTWSRPFTDDERTKYTSQLRAFYDHFLDLVAQNRRLPVDSVDRLSRGRVWTGRSARGNGLVDQVGGVKDALDWTAECVGITDYRVVIYPQKRPLLLLPGGSLVSTISRHILGDRAGDDVRNVSSQVIIPEGIYARIPFDISIE